MVSVLWYSILSVQIVYSVQLNATDSKYRETEWLYVELLNTQHINFANILQIVKYKTLLYLQ